MHHLAARLAASSVIGVSCEPLPLARWHSSAIAGMSERYFAKCERRASSPPLLWIAEAQLEVLEPLVEELLCVVGEAERRRLAELVVLVEREQVLVQGARALSRDPIGAAVDEPPDCA